jgi:hypothetical protein
LLESSACLLWTWLVIIPRWPSKNTIGEMIHGEYSVQEMRLMRYLSKQLSQPSGPSLSQKNILLLILEAQRSESGQTFFYNIGVCSWQFELMDGKSKSFQKIKYAPS